MAPFRDDLVPAIPSADPLARFIELYRALEADRGWFGDRVPLRYSAITLLTTPGDATELAAAIRRCDRELRDRLGWLSEVDPSIRMVLSAQLTKYGDTPEAFLHEVERVRQMFRAVGLRRGGVFQVLATLVLRRVLQGEAAQEHHVARFGEIYEQLKQHHWFLTGPDDYPACAMLVGQPGTPKEIGDGVEAVYQALRTDADLWRGEALQTAANVLYLSRLLPEEIALRFRLLATGLGHAGYRVRQADYDEVAVLCFLATPVDKLVDTVLGYLHEIRSSLATWVDKTTGLSLASSLTFVRLVGDDARLGPIAEAKLLLDMQAIITARQAVAAG